MPTPRAAKANASKASASKATAAKASASKASASKASVSKANAQKTGAAQAKATPKTGSARAKSLVAISAIQDDKNLTLNDGSEFEDDFLDMSEANAADMKPKLTKTEQNSREFVLRSAQDRNVKFIRLWFTDILGMLKSTAITVDELEAALDEGVTFDGSVIEGFAREDESDMIALPDPNTFTMLPFRPSEGGSVARIFCDIMMPDGKPADSDPRNILKRQLKAAADLGFTFYVGPEVEFFYFKQAEEGGSQQPIAMDTGGYFDLTPLDVASGIRRQTVLTLEEMDIGVESSHHEGAPSQHEIDLRYTDALTMADSLMTFRLVVKEIAYENDCYATFMPKPFSDQNGSGMHINMSLFKGAKNAFYDKDAPDHLSETALFYVAGLLRHARELTLFTNQWVNSYKRLVPGFEAPTRVTWAMRNRADLVRIPAFKPGRESSRRIEYRSPDPACNPYLVFALLLAAGMEGIKNRYEIPEVVGGIHQMSNAERREAGIEVLPADLNEAIIAARGSELARSVLGEALFNKFVDNKKMEWENYRSQVHEYEIDRYLSVL